MVPHPHSIDIDDDEALAMLRSRPEFQGWFGVSLLQRNLKWGYNRAARASERAISSGHLVRGVE